MKVAMFVKVASELLNYPADLDGYIQRYYKRELKKYTRGWIGNKKIDIGFSGNDFITNRRTVIISFDYIPTPRIFRKAIKAKRNILKRYK